MKLYKIILLILFLAIARFGRSQSVGFSYQAVALDQSKSERPGQDSDGEVLASEDITVRFTITEESAEGAQVYQESHDTRTDIYGMFRLIVGRGAKESLSSEIEQLQWGEIAYFLHVELYIDNQYEYFGSEELLGSPYALNSQPQQLSMEDGTLLLSNGGSVELPSKLSEEEVVAYAIENGFITEAAISSARLTEAEVDDYISNNGYLTAEVDGSITNEIQDISLAGTVLSISSGNSVDLVGLQDGNTQLTDADIAALGYVKNMTGTPLTEAEVDTYVSNNGYLTSFTEVDGSITNEIQDLDLTGDDLTITNNGSATTIDLSGYLDNTDTQLTEAQVDTYVSNNGYLTSFTEVDGSITNEIQDLDLTGDDLTITNNGSATTIDLSGYLDNTDTQLTEAQVDTYVSNNGYLTSFTEVDGSITNEIQDLDLTGDDLTITNNGSATTIDLSGYLDNTDTQLTEAQVDTYVSNNGYLTTFTEVDGSITNEIQDLDLTGDDLTITNNGSATTIDLSGYLDNTDSQDLASVLGNGADANSISITNMADPSDPQDAATKNYVDGISKSFETTTGVISNSPGTTASDDFVFGSTSLADIAGTDDDFRFFFDKSKGAFRAGGSVGTYWDDSNVGIASTTLGVNNIASALASASIGAQNEAFGNSSMAFGHGNKAHGSYSAAFGFQTEASAVLATAFGISTVASGNNSTAMGNGSKSISFGEVAMGIYNTEYTPISTTAYNSADRLLVVGNGLDNSNRADAFIVYKNGNAFLAGALTQSSDRRLKERIVPLTKSLAKLTAIQGFHYYWNSVRPKNMDQLQTGFIAQEVEKLFPELVEEDAEGFKAVNYTGFIPHLVEAIHEMKAENDELREKQEIMESRLAALEAMLANKF
ncbi:MAG: tail fiber domain-containing protein [Reichenbachiella sp.]|uniref:tail fiber domain-containing protein n=1 Tax=Reichenbachiella sp. TaxID=2184521 RepID=UPI003267B50B